MGKVYGKYILEIYVKTHIQGKNTMSAEHVDVEYMSLLRQSRNAPQRCAQSPAESGQERLSSGKEHTDAATLGRKRSRGKAGASAGADLPPRAGKLRPGSASHIRQLSASGRAL